MMESSGEMRREDVDACLSTVIARSQQVRPFGRPDDRLRDAAIQSPAGGFGLLRCARNDGVRCLRFELASLSEIALAFARTTAVAMVD